MFEFSYFFDFINDPKTNNNYKRPNLFAIHFNRMSAYNKDWNLNKILLYEYLLVCDRKYGKKDEPFTQAYKMIRDATHMSHGTISSYLKKLEKDGYLKIKRETVDGTKQLNWYTIDYDKIKASLKLIYNFDGLSKYEIKAYCEDFCKWYDYHSSKSYNFSDSKNKSNDGLEDISIT